MCSPAFSWSINKNGKFFYRNNLLSHSAISEYYNLPDDMILKGEYNWWKNYNPEEIIWHSLPFEPTISMIENSIQLVKKYFHNRDATFEWVKNNFSDQHVPEKFVTSFNEEEVVWFLNKFKNDLPSSQLTKLVEYTLNEEIVNAVFSAGMNRFTTEDLFLIVKLSPIENVKMMAFEAGHKNFSPSQNAEICLNVNIKEISKKAFNLGLKGFSINELVDIAKYINTDGIDEAAFRKGSEVFTSKEFADIAMHARNFKVRQEASLAHSVMNPRMDY